MEEGRCFSGTGFKHGVFTFTQTDHLITHAAFVIYAGDYSQIFKKEVGPRAQRLSEVGVVGQRCIDRL